MGRLQGYVPLLKVLLFASACAGCGGGLSVTQPPPPVPDFSLNLSTNSISVSQGGSSSAVTVSVNPSNGFAGNVQVALSGLPTGVTSNPPSPFDVAPGGSISLVFGAATNTAKGNFTVSAQANSGTLSHLQTLGLTVQASVASMLPRTSYIRTDSIATADASFGEPHHRHIAYDPVNKHAFVANRAMNRVEVFSTSTQTRVAQISVPGATSADLSADGTTVWIGSARNEIAAVDLVSLTVKNRYALAGLTPIPNVIFDRPLEVLALSSGKAMIRLRQAVGAEALLALWDPVSNSVTSLTGSAPAVFQSGVGVMARSGDYSKVLAAANDSSGEMALFDSGGSVITGPVTIGAGQITWAAANNDGSRFAVVFLAGNNAQVFLLNGSLQQISAYSASNVSGVIFSRDGKELYVAETSGGASVITALNGQSGQLIGRVPDIPIQGVASVIEDADETQILFALSNRGFSFIDSSTPGTLSLTAPTVAPAPAIGRADCGGYFSDSWRAQFCRPGASRIRLPVGSKPDGRQLLANPNRLTARYCQRRGQPDRLLSKLVACPCSRCFQLRPASLTGSSKRSNELRRRFRADLWLRLWRGSDKNQRENRRRLCHSAESRERYGNYSVSCSRLQLSLSPRTHHAANACWSAWQSRHSYFCARRFHNFFQSFSIFAERPILSEASTIQISYLRSATATHLSFEHRSRGRF